ncbi:MAG: gliding motility-associated C-terminal domain-containing protein, partial [Bacteroidetes bacterium]|nr:gliding motility-associated C-terminal domain-containing protein [Bacteroidota bacterium]
FLLPSGVFVTVAGVYVDPFASVYGCDSVWTTTVIVHPTFAPAQTVEICDNDSFLLPSGTFVATTGVYVDSFATVFGCDSVWTTTVIVRELVTTNISQIICEGSEVEINGIIYNQAGTYTDTLNSQIGCDSILLIDISVLKNSAGKIDTTICPNSYINIYEQTFSDEGEYRINLHNHNGCDSILTLIIRHYPEPFIDAGEDLTVIPNEIFTLESSNFPTDYLSLSWSHLDDTLCTDCFSVEQSTTENTSYIATVVDTNNCFYKDEVFVFLDKSCPENGILAPNIITPNGDMHNDEFYIKNPNELEIDYYRIFNRWGELVFETYDPNGKWDGTFRNQICNPGVYVYYVQAKCFDKTPFMKKGNITILK